MNITTFFLVKVMEQTVTSKYRKEKMYIQYIHTINTAHSRKYY